MVKKIVLLSDGTGNSSAKLQKTNVWRVYQALDGRNRDQIAFYDNGVGTSQFRFLAIASGVFGWGLEKNVRKLYEFLCWNYKPGDEIYGFGFSRGAFTIRMLIGLIEDQGLIDYGKCKNEADFYRRAKQAQRQFRANFNSDGGRLERRTRLLFKLINYPIVNRFGRGKKSKSYDKSINHLAFHKANCPHGVTVKFVGLWDTVDAYGGPIDEITRGWDRWIWPLQFRNKHLWPGVRKACHALALDDERSSFSPQLWNEVSLRKGEAAETDKHQSQAAARIIDERISQVWFAGMHSDVGGGYPDEPLSLVSCKWIMENAEKAGLKFRVNVRDQYYAAADPFGTMHNSRSGLGTYYRYRPRRIESLIENDKKLDIERHKIHYSVFDRIGTSAIEYSPIVLPRNYAVVTETDEIKQPDGKFIGFESLAAAASRISLQERVWDFVWWRQICYFATIFVTILLVSLPWIERFPVLFWPLSSVHYASKCSESLFCFLSGLPKLAGVFLPSFFSVWLNAFSANPGISAALFAAIVALVVRSKTLSHRIQNTMTRIWEIAAQQSNVSKPRPLKLKPTCVQKLRSNDRAFKLMQHLRFRFLPAFFGLASLAIVVWIPTAVSSKLLFSVMDSSGKFCGGGSLTDVKNLNVPVVLTHSFSYQNPCFSTGFKVENGGTYQIAMISEETVATGWFERADFAGHQLGHGWFDWIFWPLKRQPNADYQQPIARIQAERAQLPFNMQDILPEKIAAICNKFRAYFVPTKLDDYVLSPTFPFATGDSKVEIVSLFTAESSGTLYIYANDAVFFHPNLTYQNNVGRARVALQRVYRGKPPDNLLDLIRKDQRPPR